MPAAPRDRRPADRYDVTGNAEAQYADDARTVLVNRMGLTNLHALYVAEEAALARAYELLLGEVTADTPMTNDLIRRIHALVFGGLYDWAGRWRTVRISKPGVSWPPPDFLDDSMRTFEREVLTAHPASALAGDAAFCKALARIQGEFLSVHPFREGNARTIKLATDLLSSQTGRPLLRYDDTEYGRTQYIDAAKAALVKDYGPIEMVIRETLARSTKGT